MRASPRSPSRDAFKHHARPKWWRAAELECIKKRESGGAPSTMTTFDAMIKWHWGPRTPEEELWFGEGGDKILARSWNTPNPLWSMLQKTEGFYGDSKAIEIRSQQLYGVSPGRLRNIQVEVNSLLTLAKPFAPEPLDGIRTKR